MYRPDPLRWAVVSRLTIAGRLHAGHVRDRARPGGTALAHHAVMFCYHLPDSGISLASRLFNHDDIDEITDGRHDLPTVLRTLHARGAEFLDTGRLDPRLHLATHLEPDLARDIGRGPRSRAAFLGVATSTLHTSETAAPAHPGAPRTPPTRRTGWTALARLVDGTALALCTPDLTSTTTPLDVESTHNLARTGHDSLFAHQPWRWAHTRHRPDAQNDPDRDDARATLDLLHHLVANRAAHRDVSRLEPTPVRHHQVHA